MQKSLRTDNAEETSRVTKMQISHFYNMKLMARNLIIKGPFSDSEYIYRGVSPVWLSIEGFAVYIMMTNDRVNHAIGRQSAGPRVYIHQWPHKSQRQQTPSRVSRALWLAQYKDPQHNVYTRTPLICNVKS